MNGLFNLLKQWLLIAALLVGFVGANAQVRSNAKSQQAIQNEYLIDGDTFIPIPWGKESPISWMLLSGSWMLRQADVPTSYFTFKVLNQNGSAKVLLIQQVDPKTCAIMGAGMGSLTASNKIIYATLRNGQNRDVYRLNLRNFATTSFVKKVPASYEGTVVMMSVAAINNYNFTHFSMARVNANMLANPTCRLRLR